jgi:iron complex outermembrane receptor protein
MPSDRSSISTKYAFDINEQIKNAYVSINGQYVFRQNRLPINFDQIDYPRPPAAYFLLNAQAGIEMKLRQQPILLSLAISNMLNQKYRDYLDVFRYFIDQPGTNVSIRCSMPF